MNTPNKLSLLRVALIPVLVLCMYLPGWPMILVSAAVFGAAAYTDYLDGHIARRDNIVTDFGKFIDPVADKLLNLSAMIMLTYCGLLPQWAVIVILARELAVDGLRMVAVGQGRVIAAGKLGKIKVSGTFAETVDGAMDTADAAFNGGESVDTRQIVVVVSVKVTAQFGEGGAYQIEGGREVRGIKPAQSVAEHETLNGEIFQETYLSENIIK